jgi:hypothetical protein
MRIGTFALASSKSTRHAWSARHMRPPFISSARRSPIRRGSHSRCRMSARAASSRPHSAPAAPAASMSRCLTTSTWRRTTTRRSRRG